jgi:hypothetical protein
VYIAVICLSVGGACGLVWLSLPVAPYFLWVAARRVVAMTAMLREVRLSREAELPVRSAAPAGTVARVQAAVRTTAVRLTAVLLEVGDRTAALIFRTSTTSRG